jgi:hypothetical protein
MARTTSWPPKLPTVIRPASAGFAPPISNGAIQLWLKLVVHVEAHQRESKVTWEYDVLPFLPAGSLSQKGLVIDEGLRFEAL